MPLSYVKQHLIATTRGAPALKHFVKILDQFSHGYKGQSPTTLARVILMNYVNSEKGSNNSLSW